MTFHFLKREREREREGRALSHVGRKHLYPEEFVLVIVHLRTPQTKSAKQTTTKHKTREINILHPYPQ